MIDFIKDLEISISINNNFVKNGVEFINLRFISREM